MGYNIAVKKIFSQFCYKVIFRKRYKIEQLLKFLFDLFDERPRQMLYLR